jgi:hypothetical protein
MLYDGRGGGRLRGARWPVIVEDEERTTFIIGGIAQSGLDIYRAVRGEAILEVNKDRPVATITSPEA